jgi:acetate kinase
MKSTLPSVLTINGGSSSVRFAVYEVRKSPQIRLSGKIDRIGLPGAALVIDDPTGGRHPARRLMAADRHRPERFLLDWIEAQPIFASVRGVGHRVVYGMKHSEPERVTRKLVAEFYRAMPYDPDHLPGEVALVEEFRRRHPRLPQVACFDTAFHRTMPRVAKLLPLPRRYIRRGVERYGFHGLSYSYLMEELGRIDPAGANGRVILAHLGSGASVAAVHQGKSIDTSMGFTPTAGLVMGTRAGDLDPGLVYYLARSEQMTAARFQRLVNHQSGLLGVSGSSSDLRLLLGRENRDVRAAEAVTLFSYQAKKWIGAYAAALGGLDTLVFAGGIGENAPTVRERICQGLGFLGIEIDAEHNARNAPVISTRPGRVKVRIIRTNEELMIARSVIRVLKLGSTRGPRQ